MLVYHVWITVNKARDGGGAAGPSHPLTDSGDNPPR